MIEERHRAGTIHEEFESQPDAYRSRELADEGRYYVLNLILSDMHGAYMPAIQSGPYASYDEAWYQGLCDNVRTEDGRIPDSHTGDRFTEVRIVAARAFSIQNLTPEEVARFRSREGWLFEPMVVPQKDERGHVSMRTMERPFA